MKTALSFILLCYALSAKAFDYGVATGDPHPDPFHFGVASGWNQIASSGATWVRFDINESSILDANGNYALNSEKLNFLTLAHAAGLKTMIIVGAGPPIFSISSLSNPWDIPTYAKACQLLVQNNPGLVNGIEVLNEPNNSLKNATAAQIAPETDWRNYLVDMTNAAHVAVAGAVPVIGCGIQGSDILYCLSLKPSMDGIVVHPYADTSVYGGNSPESAFEPPDKDYETWLGHLQAATTLPIWETEFAENNGSDSYVRTVWLARRFIMALGNGVAHWMPFGWIFNSCNPQEMVDWTSQDPRLPYYLMRHMFFGAGNLGSALPFGSASGKPTFSSTDPNFVQANAKGYLFGSTAAVWQGNDSPNWLKTTDGVASVSFPFNGTNTNGSYFLNLVKWEATPIPSNQISVANGVVTVAGVHIGSEVNLVVISPGASPTPTPTPTPSPTPSPTPTPTPTPVPTPTPTPTPTPAPCVQDDAVSTKYGGSINVLTVAMHIPQKAGDTITVVATPATGIVSVSDISKGDTYTQVTPGTWQAVNVVGLTWIDSVTVQWNGNQTNPTLSVTECTPGGAPTPTPTPTPVPTPTPTPIPTSGIQPSVTLPAGFTLQWNQDFSSSFYSPTFNVPAVLSTSGPPGSIWKVSAGEGGEPCQFNGEGDPFSTSLGFLTIRANGSGTPPYGGSIRSATLYWRDPPGTPISGFVKANAYWEIKAMLPAGGSERWPALWLRGSGADTEPNGNFAEVDIAEFPSAQENMHVWGATPSGDTTPGSFFPSVSSGWHVWGCLIQGSGTANDSSVSIYIDGVLSHTFTGLDSAFSFPMCVIFDNVFGPGSVPTGQSGWTNTLSIQYVRCWSL